MKGNPTPTYRQTLCLVLALGSLVFTSCTVHVNTAKQSSLQAGSPLSGIKPLKVFVGPFEDARGLAPDFVGHLGVKDYKLDKPVAATVQDALRNEFERNGHTCLAAGREQEADLVVNGTVYQYSLNEQVGLATARVTSNVGVKISIKAPSRASDLFAKKYDGSYSSSGMVMSIGTVIKIQNEALLNMIKEFTTDRELLDFLTKSSP